MSDFNKILAFQQIMPYLSKDQQESLANVLNMDMQEAKRRLVGKNKEDEFLVILLFMGVCKSISGFDEGISQLLRSATSDLLIELKNGDKFMLEIKHTDKERYSISSGNLEKRIDFAHKYGLKLYFAISIKGYWMLFDETYLKKRNGKIDFSDLTKSDLDRMLGCVSYIFPKSIRIKSVYSTTAIKTMGVQFEPHGKLVSYELYYGNKRIFRVKGTNSPFFGYIILLGALQDRLSIDTQKIEKSGDFTIINESFSDDFNAISEYKFLLAPIEHTAHGGNEKYTAHTYIEKAKEDDRLLKMRFQKKQVREMMQYMADNGVDLMYIKNNLIYQINPKN